jgi:ribosomal protein S18 acetylase RimI-like enzyme
MLTFRDAVAGDVPALHTLVNRAYRGDSSRLGWTTEAHLLGGQRADPEMLSEMLSELGAVVRLAFMADGDDSVGGGAQMVGCVQLRMKGHRCYLGMLTIDPSKQNLGLGRELLADAESWAQAKGATAMWMTVIHTRKELISWYERRGYAHTGHFVEFPHHDERYGVVQVKTEDLRMEILEKKLG